MLMLLRTLGASRLLLLLLSWLVLLRLALTIVVAGGSGAVRSLLTLVARTLRRGRLLLETILAAERLGSGAATKNNKRDEQRVNKLACECVHVPVATDTRHDKERNKI